MSSDVQNEVVYWNERNWNKGSVTHLASLTSDLFTRDKLSETIVCIPVAPIAFFSSTNENKH
jgi:hypothetical protein